ncbi:hypothetical protein [Amorphus sp. MBR-141]
MSGVKSGLKWALIVAAGLAVAPAAAQAKDSFSIVVNPAPQAAPRYAPPRQDYHRYRDRSAYRYRDDRRHDARRGPPAHAPAYGYRRDNRPQQQQLAPGIYIVTPRN